MYYDKLKETIIKMLKESIGNDVVISDTIHKFTKKDDKKVLFNGYIDDNKSKFKIISLDDFTNFGIEKVPELDNIIDFFIQDEITEMELKILEYDSTDGIVTVDGEFDNLIIHINEFRIKSSDVNITENTDMIVVNAHNGFNKTLTGSLVEHYRRFDFIYYVYDDDNGSKSNHYMDKISTVFNRDFVIYDESKVKTKEYAYIVEQLRWELVENNLSNKIIRGTQFVRTYK